MKILNLEMKVKVKVKSKNKREAYKSAIRTTMSEKKNRKVNQRTKCQKRRKKGDKRDR